MKVGLDRVVVTELFNNVNAVKQGIGGKEEKEEKYRTECSFAGY